MLRSRALAFFVALSALAAACAPAHAEAQFPLGSRLGLTPPTGMTLSDAFPGFEDRTNNTFVRLIALPDKAFAEIEKTMTNDALKKQGMTVDKRETVTLPSGKALLVVTRQKAGTTRIRKWLLIAPIADLTALVSFETPEASRGASRGEASKGAYTNSTIRAALVSVAARASVPVDEQLSLLPFRIKELGGFRLVGVVPGRAAQFTEGPKDEIDTIDQPHLVVGVAAGGPPQPSERDSFARLALSGLPPLKDIRMTSSESMRLSGQPGHEIRAEGKDPKTGHDVEIVQWLRFGNGAYLRIVGLAPKEGWTPIFARFRAVRDGLEPR